MNHISGNTGHIPYPTESSTATRLRLFSSLHTLRRVTSTSSHQRNTATQQLGSPGWAWVNEIVRFRLSQRWENASFLTLRSISISKSWLINIILDESTVHQHLKSPRSLSGRSLHLTLVTKWSRSHMTLKIQISKSWPRSNPLSHLRPRVQNWNVCCSFHGHRTTFGWDIANFTSNLENSRSRSQPRSNVMVTFEA